MGRVGPAYISPNVQRDAIQRWADYSGVEIAEWHFDEDHSGGTQNRPGLREAMRRIETAEVEGIACWKLNRFGRNVAGALEDIRRIQQANGSVVFVEEQIDTSGPFGQFLLTVLLAIAAWERDNLSASFAEAKERAIQRGAYVSRTPWGFQRNPDSTLSPHPERAEIVREAFYLAAGRSLQDALAYLKRAAPERHWTATKARRLLSQRSYLGETRTGQFVQPGTHEALVPRSIWEAAQTTPNQRKPAERFPLSGLARCGSCNAPMIGGRGGVGQRVYRCSAAHGGSRRACQQGCVITADTLEQHIRDVVRPALEGLRAHISEPGQTEHLTLLERTLADAEAELDLFAADMTMRKALGDRYHRHLNDRVDAVEKARGAYREHARGAQVALTLELADIEQDPRLFPVLLRSIFKSIIVSRGRGAVTERVRLVPLDSDAPIGVSREQRET